MKLDHVIHIVDKPEQIIPVLTEIGLKGIRGGRHSRAATYNALSYFGLSYIEYLGTLDRQQTKEENETKYSFVDSLVQAKFKEGLSRIAIRTEQIDQLAEQFKRTNLSVTGPLPMQRQTPEGETISWKLLYVGSHEQTIDYPFFIQWDATEKERKEKLETHFNGEMKLKEIIYRVSDPLVVAKEWSLIFKPYQSEENSIFFEVDGVKIRFVVEDGLPNEVKIQGEGKRKTIKKEIKNVLYIIEGK